MSVMKLDQILGMLALTTALCSSGVALAECSCIACREVDQHSDCCQIRSGPFTDRAQFTRSDAAGRSAHLDRCDAELHRFCRSSDKAAGHAMTADIIAEWGTASPGVQTADNASFAKDPPNATVSVFKDGSVKDVVLVLKSPKLEGEKLTFNVQVLEGNINGADGPASIFIDIIGRPLGEPGVP
jgi:hypothetical protein